MYRGLLILMRQLLEVSFSHLVMFGIVFRMFRLFSSSCHQFITTELHFTNKSWLEPTWLGYCCLREFEKIIISLPLEIDRHRPNCRQSHLFTVFLSWAMAFGFLEELTSYLKREHTYKIFFTPIHCTPEQTWIFILMTLHNRVPTASPPERITEDGWQKSFLQWSGEPSQCNGCSEQDSTEGPK